jgi:hypothetical protein
VGLISARPASDECIARNVSRYTQWSLKTSLTLTLISVFSMCTHKSGDAP